MAMRLAQSGFFSKKKLIPYNIGKETIMIYPNLTADIPLAEKLALLILTKMLLRTFICPPRFFYINLEIPQVVVQLYHSIQRNFANWQLNSLELVFKSQQRLTIKSMGISFKIRFWWIRTIGSNLLRIIIGTYPAYVPMASLLLGCIPFSTFLVQIQAIRLIID